MAKIQNIAKGTMDPRVEFCLPKFKQVQAQISIKFHFQNLKHELQNPNQTSASRPKIKFKILDKASFRIKISIKIQLHNLHKTSVANYSVVLTKLQLKNLA